MSTPPPISQRGEGHYVKLMRQFLVKYIYIYVKFLMYKIFFLKIFEFLYFLLPLFFPFLAIADFIEEIDRDIIMLPLYYHYVIITICP